MCAIGEVDHQSVSTEAWDGNGSNLHYDDKSTNNIGIFIGDSLPPCPLFIESKLVQDSSLSMELLVHPIHYYVNIPHGQESTYEPSEQNMHIGPTFQVHLQEQHKVHISQFLALLKIMLAQKQKGHQSFLDFTRSQILTSTTYSQDCEQLLVQREANKAKEKYK